MRIFFIDKQTKMQKSISIFMSFLLLLCAASAFGQTGTVTGTITDSSRDPLVGVNVSVKGTTNGTITDVDGKFSLSGVSPQAVLLFSYIGFVSQEVTAGNQRTVNIQLREDAQSLEEVIVIGYGTRKAGELTGAVSTIKSEDIQKLAITSAGEALRNVPGLTVTQSYVPGGETNVRVRGLGTINNTSPLWVVDGVPGGTVSPNDIATLTVLKDASSQAIYGTRAANGVILVTTKQGKKGERTALNINLRTGVRSNTNHYNLLNTKEYGQLLWLEAQNDGIPFNHSLYGPDPNAADFIPDYLNPAKGKLGQVDESLYKWGTIAQGANLITKANKEGTDWFKAIERAAMYTDLSASLTGSSDRTTYSYILGYLNEDGVMKYTGYDRWNLRANITSDVNKWLTVGQSISGTFTNQYGLVDVYSAASNITGSPYSAINGEFSPISWAYRMQPIVPVYDVGGNYAGTRANSSLGNGRNPLGVLDLNKDNHRERMALNGNVFANITILEGLQFRTLAGLNYNTFKQKYIEYYDNSHSEGRTIDILQMTAQWTKQWNWINTLEYKKRIGVHDFTLMASTEAIESDWYQMTAQRQNYALRDADFMELSSGIDSQQNNSQKWGWALFSCFGRLNYIYDNKYLFEAVVRRDGSSRFAAKYRYGTFPAFSAGWVILREKFMESTRNWLDFLKLRVGYGLSGNDILGGSLGGNYNSYSTYIFEMNEQQGTFYAINGANGVQGALGFRQELYGINDAKWETTRTTNIGIDAAFLDGFVLDFDVWQRRTTDMLYPKAIPAVFGRVSQPTVNIGEMKNTGFDLNLSYRGTAMSRELFYTLNMNISHYKNKIIKLGREGEFLTTSLRQMEYTRAEPGTAFPEFYGYVVEGIFETQAEVDAWPTMGDYNKIGRYKFKDISGPDGVPDGKIDAYDRQYIGSPHPKFVGGLNFTFEYKGFDLTGEFYGSYGNKMINYVRRWLDYKQFLGGRSYESLHKSYGSPWLEGKATLPLAETRQEHQYPSSIFIEDASYLRLRNLQLGFDLGRMITIPTVYSLRIYLQATNLFTLTKYSGLDPETTSAAERTAQTSYGIDQGQWPTPRQFMVGLSVGL